MAFEDVLPTLTSYPGRTPVSVFEDVASIAATFAFPIPLLH
jgi:hypothetical protein